MNGELKITQVWVWNYMTILITHAFTSDAGDQIKPETLENSKSQKKLG